MVLRPTVGLSAFLSFCLSVCLSVCLSICLSFCLQGHQNSSKRPKSTPQYSYLDMTITMTLTVHYMKHVFSALYLVYLFSNSTQLFFSIFQCVNKNDQNVQNAKEETRCAERTWSNKDTCWKDLKQQRYLCWKDLKQQRYVNRFNTRRHNQATIR